MISRRSAIGDNSGSGHSSGSIGTSAFVVLSDIFIAVSFLMALLATLVALTSSSAMRQVVIRSNQEKLSARMHLKFPTQWGKTLFHFENGNIQRFTFADSVLFDSGQYKTKPEARPVLATLAAILRDEIRAERVTRIVIEGNTDIQQISPGTIPGVNDNWDLSTLRAMSVVRDLQADDVPPSYLTATGRGEFSPLIEPDRSADMTQEMLMKDLARWPKNRRIEVLVVYAAGETHKR